MQPNRGHATHLSQSEKNEHPLTPRFCDEKEWCEFFRNSVKPSVMFSCAMFFSDVVFGFQRRRIGIHLYTHICNMYMFLCLRPHVWCDVFPPVFVCALVCLITRPCVQRYENFTVGRALCVCALLLSYAISLHACNLCCALFESSSKSINS